MKYLKRFKIYELNGSFKDETEIIYKDNNLVCLIPKSQKSAYLFGSRTGWCFTKKADFDSYTKNDTIIINFLFKEKSRRYSSGSFGYKLRLMYFPINKRSDWGDASGFTCLSHHGDPFKITNDVKQESLDKFPDNQDMIHEIVERLDSIPMDCKQKVFKYLNKEVNFTYNNDKEEYKNINMVTQKEEYMKFKRDYFPQLLSFYPENNLKIEFNTVKNKFIISYTINGTEQTKETTSFSSFIDELFNITKSIDLNLNV